MDQELFLLATVDVDSPWDVADTPFMAVHHRLDPIPLVSLVLCPACRSQARAYDAKEEQRRNLNSLLNEAYLHAVVPRVQGSDEGPGRKKIGVPWARPGTGCTQLFEALVMALIRQMPVKAAAAILGTGDARLWRAVDNDPEAGKKVPRSEAGFPVIDRRKGRNYLSLFYDLDVSFDVPNKDSISAKTFAEDLTVNKERAGNLGAGFSELSKAFILAVIDALLRAARALDHFRVIKDKKDALGKVSAEEGMLYPGKSRAPPKTDLAQSGSGSASGRSTENLVNRPTSLRHWPPATLKMTLPAVKTACMICSGRLEIGDQHDLSYLSDSLSCLSGETQ